MNHAMNNRALEMYGMGTGYFWATDHRTMEIYDEPRKAPKKIRKVRRTAGRKMGRK